MTNVSRVAGLGGNYKKKKKYAEKIVHYLLKHTSTKKQQKMVGVWYSFIYFFISISMFKSQLKISNCMRGLLTQVQLIDLRSSIKITDFWTVEKNIEFSVVNPIDVLLVIPICFVDTNLLLKICYK